MALPAHAAPRAYSVKPGSAEITFLFSLSGAAQQGTAPLITADLRIDPSNLAASKATVAANLARARTGLIFATQALKSPSVLDTVTHPTARFQSTRVILGPNGRISDGAALLGRLTLRGVTRDIRFKADLFRPRGSAADDLSTLDVRLSGSISRAAYGATGYADLVPDKIDLQIRAEITASG